jgi:hypothetical protein
VSADLTAHPIAFGGLALVPVSDAGGEWLWCEPVWRGMETFTAPDGCMTGFPDDAIGFEPQDWPEIVTAARESGLIVEKILVSALSKAHIIQKVIG